MLRRPSEESEGEEGQTPSANADIKAEEQAEGRDLGFALSFHLYTQLDSTSTLLSYRPTN